MGIETKTIGQLIDELITADIKCYMAQEPGGDLNLAQAANKRRCALIQAIDKMLTGQVDISQNKTYQ